MQHTLKTWGGTLHLLREMYLHKLSEFFSQISFFPCIRIFRVFFFCIRMTYRHLFYTLWYNSIVLDLLCLKFSSCGHWNLFQGSHALLIYPHRCIIFVVIVIVCFILFYFLVCLLSDTTRWCSRIILYISCPSLWIRHFFQEDLGLFIGE